MPKRKFNFFSTILEWTSILPNVFNLARSLTSLVRLEAQLAGKNIGKMLFCTLLFSLLSLSAWLCLMMLLFAYLVRIPLELIPCLWIIFGLHAVLLVALGIIATKIKRHLVFSETRKQISRFK